MYNNGKLSALLLVLSLVACGGGSGGSSYGGSNDSGGSGNDGGSTSESGDSGEDFSAIVGLYDISTSDNEQYYYIDEDGVFTAYNYLGDAVDSGDNCYRESEGDEANASISGQTLTALSSGDFSIDVNGTEVTFEMEGDEVSRVSTPQLSAGGTLSITVDGDPVRLATNLAAAVTIDDIDAMTCE